MAFDPGGQQPPMWSSQPQSHLDSQVGGLFFNLESQDAHLDFHEPAQDLWGGDSQTQGTWDPTVDLANNVAEVALQETVFPDPGTETLSAVPFQDVDGQAPREPAFQETGAGDSSEDEGTPKDLPAWTCSYCGTHNPKMVAQCEVTGKWFCNGHVTKGGTCVIQHLVRGRYKEVRLHPQSPLGNTILECYHSGSRNIFSLGFVPVKGDDTIVLLARDTPATASCVKELDLNMNLWESIIQDRGIVPWLVQQPSKEDCVRARKLKPAQMNRLEAVWKVDPDATLEQVQEDPASQKDLLKVACRYENAFEYQNVLAPLVQIEADYDKACREALRKENLKVQWQQSNKRWVATFYFPRDDEALHVVPGDELVLQHDTAGANGTAWEATGVVLRITSAEEVALELHTGKHDTIPSHETNSFAAELTWNSTAYDRMHTGLKNFAENSECMSMFLYHKILGHEPDLPPRPPPAPNAYQAPNMPLPNHSQLSAIDAAIGRPFTLIQGPPGTGKTVTSTTLVWMLHRLNRSKVLMAAPSNVAVDHLAEKIASTGLKVVRLCSQRAQVSIASAVEHLTLHYQVANIKVPGHEQLQKLHGQKHEKGELSLDNERKLHALMRKFETEILAAADVVCVTCIGAGDKRLKRFTFPIVLVDESTQATEPECLLPMTLGAQQVVLVGDHCQLGPVVMNKQAERCGLSQSLVERMILCGVRPVQLQVQYRMHPCLSEFPSNTFYEGALQNGVTEAERTNRSVAFPWPDASRCLMFYQQRGVEEISSSGTSYVNRQEASAVEKIVTMFLSYDVKPQQIGVVTPYEGQRAQIVRTMEQLGPLNKTLYSQIEVASVDAFQGREKDYIIFSCVRASSVQGIGFLADPRRLNVALTRARYGCVILGNASVLCKQALWHSLLTYLRARAMLVEGPLTNLQTSHVPLPNPDYKFDRRYFLLGSTLSTRYRPTDNVVYPSFDSNGAANGTGANNGGIAGNGSGGGGGGGMPRSSGPRNGGGGYTHGGHAHAHAQSHSMGGPPLHPPPHAPPPYGAPMGGYGMGMMAPPMHARPPPLMHDNPYAIGPLVGPQGALTQEALSLDQLSQRGMSLAALGQMSLGGLGMGGGLGGNMGGMDPRSRMATGAPMGRG